jgi:deazaflavin-dependent oxidoreductase (nitroreductase family)
MEARKWDRTGGIAIGARTWHSGPVPPGWYRNLLAHPDVKIQVRDQRIPVTARTGTPQDKARVWPTMTAQWPDYDAYQGRTERDIPVVLLRPR